jgi:hypothetical protein
MSRAVTRPFGWVSGVTSDRLNPLGECCPTYLPGQVGHPHPDEWTLMDQGVGRQQDHRLARVVQRQVAPLRRGRRGVCRRRRGRWLRGAGLRDRTLGEKCITALMTERRQSMPLQCM